MKRLVVSEHARTDLSDIRRFSARRWNRDQADVYIGQIIARFAGLMVDASHGARRDDLRPGLRRINVRSHAVFYLEFSDAVEISRVLHQRMDHASLFARMRDAPGDDRP